ncbi:DNA cytosine methyltransferase [Agrobacterium tumefaciens]|uniref:DNA cytosine methyltransferase n=1 Tax=Agrobacterium tumefaciens TaxID=358 RepID=UPI001E4ADB81|nr:DNA cytosine methyltransferase [Agrobacterium tumefaciens]
MQHANDNHTGLRFLSVCSGIEAASVAWHPLGWKAVAFSEIEKFPSAVLKHHYPDVPNLGDFTKIDAKTLGRVDILAGGTPCQAFSVAGLRQSLADARGNLSLEFVRLAHELAANNGLRNVVWENVVGVLSTKDNAFGCFLAGLVGADSPIEPPRRGKWARHGMVSGPKGRAAWAVKDGQFFGVAQRRRRVLVVADFGNGADPAAVLFEPESMFRDTPPSREAGKDIAPTFSARTKGSGGLGTDFDLDGGSVESPVAYGGNRTSGPLDVATAVNAHGGPYGRLDFESETFVAHAIQAGALRTNPNSGPDGVGVQEGVAYTLEARAEVQAVAFDWYASSSQSLPVNEFSPPLKTTMQPAVAVSIRGRDGGATAELGGDIATALRASQGGGDKPHVLAQAYSIMPQNSGKDYKARPVEVAQPLMAGGPVGGNQGGDYILQSAVRRLTPKECERLQGFPDNYTDIPWRGKPTSPDGPRYKALGNSWAVPKFVWLGQRIARFMPANDNQETPIANAA